MADILKAFVEVPISLLLLSAGIVFLLIAVAGNVAGKIEPGTQGCIVSGIVGSLLLISSFIVVNYNQIPPGSYQGTCQNIYVEGDTLYASCLTPNQLYQPTNLNKFKNCKSIDNGNGSLKCN